MNEHEIAYLIKCFKKFETIMFSKGEKGLTEVIGVSIRKDDPERFETDIECFEEWVSWHKDGTYASLENGIIDDYSVPIACILEGEG